MSNLLELNFSSTCLIWSISALILLQISLISGNSTLISVLLSFSSFILILISSIYSKIGSEFLTLSISAISRFSCYLDLVVVSNSFSSLFTPLLINSGLLYSGCNFLLNTNFDFSSSATLALTASS